MREPASRGSQREVNHEVEPGVGGVGERCGWMASEVKGLDSHRGEGDWGGGEQVDRLPDAEGEGGLPAAAEPAAGKGGLDGLRDLVVERG